jgi:hypothetical protein
MVKSTTLLAAGQSATKTRHQNTWRKSTWEYVEPIKAILDDLSEFWPLTLRQVYYQLVAQLIIENNIAEYKKLSKVLSKARLDGIVPWDAIEDRSRDSLSSAGWGDHTDFIADQFSDLLMGYRRDLLQSQDVALQLWIEKDALSRIAHDVAFPYCVDVIVAKGFSSMSYKNTFRDQIERNTANGKQTIALYFGDLDPSGWEMLPAMLRTLQTEMGLGDQVIGQRCALLPEQVEEFDLPRSVDAIKETDSRTPKYREQFGDLAVELDALPPAVLQSLVRDAIERNVDMSAFERERVIEQQERENISQLRRRALDLIGEVDG